MTDSKDDKTRLDAYFTAARVHAPEPSDALLARIAAQAVTEQQDRGVAHRPVPREGLMRQFIQMLGGWPAVGGLATATCAGIWLGISPPQPMTLAAESYLGIDAAVTLLDMSPDAAFDLSEGTL